MEGLHRWKAPRPGSLERLWFEAAAVGADEGALDEALVEALVLLCQRGMKALIFDALRSRGLRACGDSRSPAATIGVKASGLSLAPFLVHGIHCIPVAAVGCPRTTLLP